MLVFFFLDPFLCIFALSHTDSLSLTLSPSAFHCAAQFSAVALAILMEWSAVLSLIDWE